jgi:hypothetical protein
MRICVCVHVYCVCVHITGRLLVCVSDQRQDRRKVQLRDRRRGRGTRSRCPDQRRNTRSIPQRLSTVPECDFHTVRARAKTEKTVRRSRLLKDCHGSQKAATVPAKTVTVPAKTVMVPAKTVTVPAKTVTVPAKTVTVPAKTVRGSCKDCHGSCKDCQGPQSRLPKDCHGFRNDCQGSIRNFHAVKAPNRLRVFRLPGLFNIYKAPMYRRGGDHTGVRRAHRVPAHAQYQELREQRRGTRPISKGY